MAIMHDPHPGPLKPNANPPAQTTADGANDDAACLGNNNGQFGADDEFAYDGYGGM